MPPIMYQDLGRLLVSVCRLHRTRADQFVSQMGLFRGQAFLLMVLSEQDGITHSEVAEKLKISPAATTKVIKRMEKEEYLQRETDAADERVSRVYLRDKGRAIISEIRGAFGEMDRMMFEGLSEAELLHLQAALHRMQANLEQYQPPAPGRQAHSEDPQALISNR